MFSGGWQLKHSGFEGSMVALLGSFLVSVFQKLKQTEPSISVTSGARPPPPSTPSRLMLDGCLQVPHPSNPCSQRGENRTNSLVPPSLQASALFIGPVKWSECDHVTRQANGMWWEERWVWVSFSMRDDLMK